MKLKTTQWSGQDINCFHEGILYKFKVEYNNRLVKKIANFVYLFFENGIWRCEYPDGENIPILYGSKTEKLNCLKGE